MDDNPTYLFQQLFESLSLEVGAFYEGVGDPLRTFPAVITMFLPLN